MSVFGFVSVLGCMCLCSWVFCSSLANALPGKSEMKDSTAVEAREASQEKNISFFSSSMALTSIKSNSDSTQKAQHPHSQLPGALVA